MNAETYLDNTGRDDILCGGARRIPISTPKGDFHVWTKRFGNNPTAKLLLLHGGPAATHEYFEAATATCRRANIEYYYYDQLGSAYSDQPDDPDLWQVDRFVDEVEQVRIALGLDAGNFFLLGHSWGGILATEYALKYQQHLKGLVISNMMMSIPAYNEYARSVLMPAMDQEVLAEIQRLEAAGETETPRYMDAAHRPLPPARPSPARRSSGRTRCSDRSRTSTDRSTCRCRDRASSAPAASSRTGTGPTTSRASRCPRW